MLDIPLRQPAQKMLSCFVTTYRCESAFSHMTKNKNRLRSQRTDVHQENQLISKSMMLEPNLLSLAHD